MWVCGSAGLKVGIGLKVCVYSELDLLKIGLCVSVRSGFKVLEVKSECYAGCWLNVKSKFCEGDELRGYGELRNMIC